MEGNAMARLVLFAGLAAALFLAVEVYTTVVLIAVDFVLVPDLRCSSCLVCRARALRKRSQIRCSSTLRLVGNLLVRAALSLTTLLLSIYLLTRLIEVFSGRIVIGLYGKTVPKTAGTCALLSISFICCHLPDLTTCKPLPCHLSCRREFPRAKHW